MSKPNPAQGQARFPVAGRSADVQYPPGRPHVVSDFTETERAQITELLSKVLGPEYISFRQLGGGKVSYIEGWRAFNLANEVFGFDGWLLEVILKEVDFLDVDKGKYAIGMLVLVRVTLKNGCYHEDFGYGYIENARSKAMAFEKCRKEAFTDGIKRCLRCFGNLLGNCLYDKTTVGKAQRAELDDPTFYRDANHVRQLRARAVSLSLKVYENGSTKAPAKPVPKPMFRPVSKDSDKPMLPLEDDSFCFSDDDVFHEDILPEDLVAATPATVTSTATPAPIDTSTPANAPVMFVSAKALEQLSKGTADLPKFDTRFVSQSMKLTIDQTRLEKIKRAPAPQASPPPARGASVNTLTETEQNTHHGRGVGLPPSKRPRN